MTFKTFQQCSGQEVTPSPFLPLNDQIIFLDDRAEIDGSQEKKMETREEEAPVAAAGARKTAGDVNNES